MGYGDELMVTGHARLLQEKDPRKIRLDYGKNLWNEVFNHNPRLARPDEVGDFQTYYPRPNGLRPYASSKSPQRWGWREYKPPVGEIYFQPEELEFAARHALPTGFVVIEPHLKAKASPNKDWGNERWRSLTILMKQAGLQPVQMGGAGTQRLPEAKLIETPSFRLAMAVLARAKAAVLTEGGLHHASAVVGTRAVVIYGGFISPAQTGYDLHENIFVGGKPCGNREPCGHCKSAMKDISPEMVLSLLKGLL